MTNQAHQGASPPDFDRQSPAGAQDGWPGAHLQSRLRLRTLVALRWIVILGELAALVVGWAVLRLPGHYGPCFGLIAAAAWINLLIGLVSPGQRLTGSWESAGQLAFDLAQFSGLLYLTGGIANPFSLMLIAPVALAAATLSRAPFILLAALAVLATLFLSSLHYAGANGVDDSLAPSLGYLLAATTANIAGIVVISVYVRRASVEAARMALALDVTQSVLAREQRLSALGALAAAAAHELGTPLATISIVARELARAEDPLVREDAELMVAQAARCREILHRLADAPDTAKDDLHARLSLLQLVNEVLEPQSHVRGIRLEAIVTGASGVAAPDLRRVPELLHALTSLVENAVDFATSEVLVTARFDAASVSLEVRDDGPGFAPEILAKLGEPYVTSRPGAEGSRSGHIGMGLGFFIAKTLLERTGAQVSHRNVRPRGAIVRARWDRADIEAT